MFVGCCCWRSQLNSESKKDLSETEQELKKLARQLPAISAAKSSQNHVSKKQRS
jgi:hypothetical protein